MSNGIIRKETSGVFYPRVSPDVLRRGVLSVHRPTRKKRIAELGAGQTIAESSDSLQPKFFLKPPPRASLPMRQSFAKSPRFVSFLPAFVPSSNWLIRPINQHVAGRTTRWFHDRLIGE